MALRILAKQTELESDPLGFNTTALVSQPDRRRLRVRVGDYRVIYTIDNGELVVWVVHVGHRSTVHDTRALLTAGQKIQHRSSTGSMQGPGSHEPGPC